MAFDPAKWNDQIFSTKDILGEIPITKYLVSPVLVLPSFNMFYGAPGSLKTNILIDLAICVSLGCDWLTCDEFKGFKVEKSSILWIDCDSGKNILHERMRAFLSQHAKSKSQMESAKIYFMSFPNPSLDVRNDAMINALVDLITKLETKLVVFDNLGTISGGADENSFEMVKVMNNLRVISERTEASVNVIHHRAKADTDIRRTPRGHSSIEAALDTVLYIDRDGDSISIVPTKQRRAPIEPFSALFEYEHFAKTQTLSRARFIGSESEPDAISFKAQNALVKFLSSNGKSGNQAQLIDVCKAVKIGRPRAISEIHRLVLKNILIEKHNQAHNQKVYVLS